MPVAHRGFDDVLSRLPVINVYRDEVDSGVGKTEKSIT